MVISDINIRLEKNIDQKKGFYKAYEKIYFSAFNYIKKIFDEKKLNKELVKIKNDSIIAMEVIKTRISISHIYKDQEGNFKIILASPILKNSKIYGVVVIDNLISYNDSQSSYQSILLTNFFIFFISIMFFISFLFSKSIITPIKMLSKNTNLERDKTYKNKANINYPNRKDEIGALSKDIKSMSNDLKKRIIEIEEFASDVSHELKNPLTSLKSSNDLLKTNKLEEKNRDLLIKNMGKDIDRMNILISDISNYTLTQVEMSEEIYEEVEIINFLNNFKNTLSNKDYELIIKNSEKEIFLKINKNKFLQVIYSLIDNSLTYIKGNYKILIIIKTDDKNCIINFVDQGPGISLDYKNKIFERFYTDRENDRNSHSGLGLSISKKIIDSFGGSLNLVKNSHFGFEGACFEIKLPLKD